MKFNLYASYFLLFLFALYYGLNWLYIDGSVYSQICFVAIILFSVVYFVKTLLSRNNKNLFFYSFTLLIILNIVGFICNPDLSESPSREMFKGILGGMLPFYPFYYFTRKGLLKANYLIIFLLTMIPIFILLFYRMESYLLADRADDKANLINNMSYSFVSLIPFAFLIKRNKLLSAGVMIILMIFIIQGAKRGAIVAGTIGMLLFFYYQMIAVEKQNHILTSLVVIIITLGLTAFTFNYMTNNEFVKERMISILAGESSGRNVIYETIFNKWLDSKSILNLIFGYGFAASVRITGDYAHNDWLELLSNFGLVGICAYLFIFYATLKYCLNREWHLDKRLLMITITLIWFFISMVSMSYTSFGGFMQSIILGFLTGSNTNSLETGTIKK